MYSSLFHNCHPEGNCQGRLHQGLPLQSNPGSYDGYPNTPCCVPDEPVSLYQDGRCRWHIPHEPQQGHDGSVRYNRYPKGSAGAY